MRWAVFRSLRPVWKRFINRISSARTPMAAACRWKKAALMMRASLNPASKLPAGRGFRSRAAAVAACLGLSVAAPAAWPSSLTPLPDFEAVKAGHTRSDLLVLDRHGEAIAALRRDYLERRGAWIPVDAISPALQRAVLLSEDRRFYEHGGVDWLAMSAAGWNWLWG